MGAGARLRTVYMSFMPVLMPNRVLQGKKIAAQKIAYKYLEIGWGVFAHMGPF